VRSFTELAGDLVADVRRAPDAATAELEALGFAMAFEAAAEDPGAEAGEVAAALAGRRDPHADAALRALALFARGPLRDAAAAHEVDVSRAPARDIGAAAAEGAWRLEARDVVAHVAWLARPAGTPQSFVLVTGADGRGAPLLGGGLTTARQGQSEDERLAEVMSALGAGDLAPVAPEALVEHLARGARTNAALLVEVSLTLAMGARVAAHALAGAADAVPDLAWSADETDTDDDRAGFVERLLARAAHDGVDATDPDALAAWFAAFQQRRPREQLKLLGLPGVASGEDQEAARRVRGGDPRRARRKAARRARRRNR